jgi:hypothetical protein
MYFRRYADMEPTNESMNSFWFLSTDKSQGVSMA